MVTFTERESDTTYVVSTGVTLNAAGNVLITREHFDPYTGALTVQTSLFHPVAARQLIGALEEILTFVEP